MISDQYLKTITGSPNVALEHVRPLADSFGLEIEFQNRECVTPAALRQASPAIREIISEHRVLVLRNAWLSALPTLQLTESTLPKIGLMQDPFHRDNHEKLTDHCITALYKDGVLDERAAPTYFALTRDVRLSIDNIRVNFDAARVIRNALEAISAPSYSFDLNAEELHYSHKTGIRTPREILQTDFPEFTQLVFETIPENHRYAHYWRRDERTIVFFENGEDGILHGRPTCGDQDVCISGLSVP